MNAMFVQVDDSELSRLVADPSSAEGLFQDGPSGAPAIPQLTEAMKERVRTQGPALLAGVLSRLDPAIRQQVEARLGGIMVAESPSDSGENLLRLMEERRAHLADRQAAAGEHVVLNLEKAWHGVHYVLCGDPEPGDRLLSSVVLGGTMLGDDDEGFSGYGPARYFTPRQVADMADALRRPETESDAAARFDADRMSNLRIYPGWQPSDAEWVMDGFRRLRDFYVDAAGRRRAVVTCLV